MILCKIFCLITKPRQFILVVQTVLLEFGNDLNMHIANQYYPFTEAATILIFYLNMNIELIIFVT